MKFIHVPEADQAMILRNVQELQCQVIVVTKADRTSAFRQSRSAVTTATVPASSSSCAVATLHDTEELGKEQKANVPQTQKSSEDARSPGASSVADGTETATPRKRKLLTSPKVMSSIPGGTDGGGSDGEASDSSNNECGK